MHLHRSFVLLKAALGENKNNGNESVRLYLKVGDQKLIIGTLSHEKFPQLSTEIVLEKGFELSHSWKNGSVYFTGYKVDASEPYPFNYLNMLLLLNPTSLSMNMIWGFVVLLCF